VALSYHLVLLVKKWSDLLNTVLLTYYLLNTILLTYLLSKIIIICDVYFLIENCVLDPLS
jgi:hypothetical protein